MIARDRIVIGASAGGIIALKQLVANLPADLHAAIFISLHMVERGEMLLPQILEAAGPLRCSMAAEGMPIEDGHIYIAPPDFHLVLSPETIHLSHGPKEGLQRPSINVMFRSAAATFGDRVTGVLLTGMLDDGAAGLWEILQCGGATVVQDPEEAAYRSMPESAIRSLNVQYILRLQEIAPLLMRLSMGERRPTKIDPPLLPAVPSLSGPPLTRQACPECGGVMRLEDRGTLMEYTCHVGHRLGLQSMICDKTDVVERSMWKVLSQSEELIELLQNSQVDADPAHRATLQAEIAARLHDMATIRAVLERPGTVRRATSRPR